MDHEPLLDQKQTILKLVIFRDDRGEPIRQGCRFHLAPCRDGRWYAWGEAHIPPEDLTPCDALYDFLNGGAVFATRAEALAEVYRYVAQFCAEEADSLL